MDYLQAITKLKEIQIVLLEFLDDETEAIEKYEAFINLVNMQKMTEEREKFRELLNLINSIIISMKKLKKSLNIFIQIQKFPIFLKTANEFFYFLLNRELLQLMNTLLHK